MWIKTPPKGAAIILATAALPLPLHHPGDHHHKDRHPGQKQHRHNDGRLRAGTRARHPHRRVAANGDLPAGLVAGIAKNAKNAKAPRAHAASDPGDVISDFKFAPSTITVHAGDTITWTNDGPSPTRPPPTTGVSTPAS